MPSDQPRSRREVLINGRRVRLSDLLDAGLIDAGQELVYQQRLDLEPHHATVTARGRLALADGREFNTPSGAAAAASKLGAVHGWIAWRLGHDGPTLHDLRQRLLKSVATEVTVNRPYSTDDDLVRARFERLNQLLEKAQAGDPEAITVRELLKIWGFGERDSTTTAAIQADLDNHGLTTSPDFRAVTLDRSVRVEMITNATPEPSPATETAVDSEDATAADIGLTLGNLLEDHVLGWVPPTATFEQAMGRHAGAAHGGAGAVEAHEAVVWRSISGRRCVGVVSAGAGVRRSQRGRRG